MNALESQTNPPKGETTGSFLPAGHPSTAAGRIGVLVVNLGSPSGTDYWSMRAYLKEFLSDRRVIEVWRPLWWTILNLFVLTTRPSRSGHAYSLILNNERNEGPLVTTTRSQAEKLDAALGSVDERIIVDWAMRYGAPSVASRTVDYGAATKSPLDTNSSFVNVRCPSCNGRAKRETDTMTTFVDSAWYYFRYCDPKNQRAIFDRKKIGYWMPVDQYIGGTEHAVGHLLYSRFITKFLKKLGYVNFDEPFLSLLNQGMVNMGGSKMSKSKGNVIDPLDMINKYGADTLRTYLLFIASPSTPFEWSDKDIKGVHKFLNKSLDSSKLKFGSLKKEYIESITQTKISSCTKHFDNLELNKVLIELMDFYSLIEKYPSKLALSAFITMLYPFAPHVSEEVWEKLGNRTLLAKSGWPEINKSKINKKAEQSEESIRTTISDIKQILKITGKHAKQIYLYVIPPELNNYKSVQQELSMELGARVQVFASNDSNKIDPEGKAKKAKPGKPGIYLV